MYISPENGQLILAAIAFLSAAMKHLTGYIAAKGKDDAVKYDSVYFYKMLLAGFGGVLLVDITNIEFSVGAIAMVFYMASGVHSTTGK